MKSLNYKYISKMSFNNKHLSILKKLGEYKGKQELFNNKSPEILLGLKRHAVIESVESSNRLEQITASRDRIKGLVEKTTTPKDRSEQEIAGYRDGLSMIHESFDFMDVNINTTLQLHSMLYRYQYEDGGKFKSTDNKIVERDADGEIIRVRFEPVSAIQTPMAMTELFDLYKDCLEDNSIDSLIAVPLMILDFLCIHPFKDGNGRLSRLLTLLLLYREDYQVGCYVSLERIFEQQKEGYYENLHKSSQGWHKGEHDPFPWLNYFWGIMLAAYKEFEEKVVILKDTQAGKGSKSELVKLAVKKATNQFKIQDIIENCPGIGRDTIRNVLRELRDQGVIESKGSGRGAKWLKK